MAHSSHATAFFRRTVATLLTAALSIVLLHCKPIPINELKDQTNPLQSLAEANVILERVRAKRDANQPLTYNDIVDLMNVVASKLIVKASERQILFQRLQEMRIPNIEHSMRTRYLEREFGELPLDRKRTIFEEAKSYLISEIVNNPSRDVREAFQQKFDSLPPSSDLLAVYELLPRPTAQSERIYPPMNF